MKKTLFIIFATISFHFTYSQDLIIKKTGDELQAKVIELTSTEVKYKRFDNLDGPIVSILKSDVFIIKYENGSKEVFKEETNANTLTVSTSVDFYNNGKIDAQKYYRGYKGAGTLTFITGFISPLIGLIPAIACSSTPPKDENLDYPKIELMKNLDYNTGYNQKAKRIKQSKVWTNWGITFGINLVAVILLSQ